MIQSRSDYLHYLSEDLRAYQLSHYSWLTAIKSPILRFQRRLRKIEYLSNCGQIWQTPYLMWLKWLNHKLGIRLGFSIPANVFGAGLCLPHYGTIVVTHKAKVGKNCRLHPGTSIGAFHGAPSIGDNVYIGPGARIFGDITIGNNVAIGANAVVEKSFGDKKVLGGIPAEVISEKDVAELGLYPQGFI